jgi:hypothetical protein
MLLPTLKCYDVLPHMTCSTRYPLFLILSTLLLYNLQLNFIANHELSHVWTHNTILKLRETQISGYGHMLDFCKGYRSYARITYTCSYSSVI